MIQEKYGNYKLSSYEPVTVKLPDFSVSGEEAIAEMKRIAARHATSVTIDPHPIQADDSILINIVTKEGNNVFPGLTHDHVDIQLGVGAMPEEIEVALLGHEVGDVVETNFVYTDYSQVASEHEAPADGGCGAGESGEPENINLVSQVEILALRKFVVPEVTDEWVSKNIALCNSASEFKLKTAARILKERRRKYANDIEYKVMDEIGNRLIEEPPADVVQSVSKQLYREFDRFLEQYEVDRPTYLAIQGLDDISFAEQIEHDARSRVIQDVALASWATHFDIKLSDEDIDFMFGEPTPERTYEARVEAEQSGQIDTFKDLALRAKVTEQITRGAMYIGPDGNEDKEFEDEIALKYNKLDLVRNHATSEPMTAPPMVPMK